MAPTPAAIELLQQTGLSDYLDYLELENEQRKNKSSATSALIIPQNTKSDLQDYAETLVNDPTIPSKIKKKNIIIKALQILSGNKELTNMPYALTRIVDQIIDTIDTYTNTSADMCRQLYDIVLIHLKTKEKLTLLERTVDELLEIMKTNITLALGRDEKIEVLYEKTNVLKDNAVAFKKSAVKLAQTSRSGNALARGMVIGIILGIFIGIAVGFLMAGVFPGIGIAGALCTILSIGAGFVAGAIVCAMAIGLSLTILRIYNSCCSFYKKRMEEKARDRYFATPPRTEQQVKEDLEKAQISTLAKEKLHPPRKSPSARKSQPPSLITTRGTLFSSFPSEIEHDDATKTLLNPTSAHH